MGNRREAEILQLAKAAAADAAFSMIDPSEVEAAGAKSRTKSDRASGAKTIRPRITRLADVEPEDVNWLWFPYLPVGKVCLLEGDPSAGKTFISLNLAAIVTTGRGFPDESGSSSGRTDPGNVLFLGCEDGLADTIRWRFDACGGDPTRFFAVSDLTDGNALFLSDQTNLEAAIAQTTPRLLIIDPLQGFLGARVDMHRSNEIRPILSGVGKLAERYGVTVLMIRHLRKSGADKAAHRGLGSIDFLAHARSVLMAGRSPKYPNERAIVHLKGSLALEGESIGYEIVPPGVLRWTGKSELTAFDLNEPESKTRPRDDAKQFLLDILAGGPVDVATIRSEADAAGVAWGTVRRAAEEIGVKKSKGSFSGGWEWSLG